MPYAFHSAQALVDLYRRGEVSPVAVTEEILARIERLNPTLRAFLTVTEDLARGQAAAAEQRYLDARRSTDLDSLPPLLGVPVSVKDLADVAGVRTTFGSQIYQDNIAAEDSFVWERLRDAGAVLLGKTNTPEFGMAAFTSNRLGDPCANPWNPERIAGGSSGGAAVAVATGLGPIAHGSDGGGSIRIPAACDGVFGIKPTGRRIPKPFWAAGMSQISTDGPLTRSVRDAALALQVMAGPHPRDPQALPDTPDDYLAACERTALSDLRIAWSPDLRHGIAATVVRTNAEPALAALRERAGLLDEATPEIDPFLETFKPIALSGAVANYGHLWDEQRDQLTDYLRWGLEEGRAMDAKTVTKAYADMDKFRAQMRLFFERYDVLLTPTMALPAFPHDAAIDEIEGRSFDPNDPLTVSVMFTAPFNLTQQPAATLPTGFDADGLPTALQIVGRHGDESTVFRVAAALEEATPWADRKPALADF